MSESGDTDNTELGEIDRILVGLYLGEKFLQNFTEEIQTKLIKKHVEDVDAIKSAKRQINALISKARIDEQKRYLKMLETGRWRSFGIEVTDRLKELEGNL